MTASVHPFPPARRRRANVTGSEHCRDCQDFGQLVVGTETRPVGQTGKTYEAEVMEPCPFCERGFRLEFGIGRRLKPGNVLEEEKEHGGPWGPDGFWKGRPIPEGLA